MPLPSVRRRRKRSSFPRTPSAARRHARRSCLRSECPRRASPRPMPAPLAAECVAPATTSTHLSPSAGPRPPWKWGYLRLVDSRSGTRVPHRAVLVHVEEAPRLLRGGAGAVDAGVGGQRRDCIVRAPLRSLGLPALFPNRSRTIGEPVYLDPLLCHSNPLCPMPQDFVLPPPSFAHPAGSTLPVTL